MAVKIPPLLSKMSKSAQKAWYKRNNMEMPDEPVERSAAAAKKVKIAPRKASDVKPDSVRAINTARMAAYMAKGGRAPIGAAGSGGNSVMAGSNMSTVRGMISGIKAGFNPKVSLDPYESERAKKIGPRSLKLKKESVDEAKNKDKKNQYVRQVGLKAMKAGKVDPARGHSPTRFGREILKKEEVEQVDELSTDLLTRYKKKAAVQASAADKAGDYNKGNKRFSGIIKATKKQLGNDMKKEEVEQVKEGAKEDAAELLGGPVKTKPKMPPGKRSPGSRYVRGLARKAMKAGMKKEEVEQIDELKKSTLASYVGKAAGRLAAASRLQRDFEKDGNTALAGEFEQSAQKKKVGIQKAANKLAKEEVEQVDELSTPTMSSYVKKVGAENKFTKKRVDGLNLALNKIKSNSIKKEEVEESIIKYIEEKLTAADPASKWISDFVKSDNPKFAGKNKKERIQQALGAYYAAKGGKNEEVEQVDEGRLGRSMRGYAVRGGYGGNTKLRYQSSGERAREINVGLDDKQEKENARRAAAADKAKMKKEEAEQVDEAKDKKSDSDDVKAGTKALQAKIKKGDFFAGMSKSSSVKNLPKNVLARFGKEAKSGTYFKEAEGKTPETDTEVQLAKKHGDPKKITYGDVIKARIASAKKKVKGY